MAATAKFDKRMKEIRAKRVAGGIRAALAGGGPLNQPRMPVAPNKIPFDPARRDHELMEKDCPNLVERIEDHLNKFPRVALDVEKEFKSCTSLWMNSFERRNLEDSISHISPADALWEVRCFCIMALNPKYRLPPARDHPSTTRDGRDVNLITLRNAVLRLWFCWATHPSIARTFFGVDVNTVREQIDLLEAQCAFAVVYNLAGEPKDVSAKVRQDVSDLEEKKLLTLPSVLQKKSQQVESKGSVDHVDPETFRETFVAECSLAFHSIAVREEILNNGKTEHYHPLIPHVTALNVWVKHTMQAETSSTFKTEYNNKALAALLPLDSAFHVLRTKPQENPAYSALVNDVVSAYDVDVATKLQEMVNTPFADVILSEKHPLHALALLHLFGYHFEQQFMGASFDRYCLLSHEAAMFDVLSPGGDQQVNQARLKRPVIVCFGPRRLRVHLNGKWFIGRSPGHVICTWAHLITTEFAGRLSNNQDIGPWLEDIFKFANPFSVSSSSSPPPLPGHAAPPAASL